MRAYGLGKVVVFYLTMLLVALAGMWLTDGLSLVLLRRPPSAWLTDAALGLATGLAVVVLTRRLVVWFAWARRLSEALRAAIGELSGSEAFAVALCSAVAEECLFRGVVQPVLGIYVASIIFGLLHAGPDRRFLPWTIMACVVGFIFGGLLHLTGHLTAPIVAHLVINFLNLRFVAEEKIGVEIDVGSSNAGRCLRP